MIIYLVGAFGTAISALVAYKLIGGTIPDPEGVTAMMTGSYIGGGVNFAALAGSFEIPGKVVAATTVADNMVMACYFFVLIAIPGSKFFSKFFPHPHMDELERVGLDEAGKTQAASYWERKPISLRDIAVNFALSAIIVCISFELAKVLTAVIPTSNPFLKGVNGFFGNKYLVMTTISMIVATVGSKHVEKVSGSQEIGTYLIYLFLFVIGVPASVMQILQNAPMLFVFCLIMVVGNMLVCFVFGKLLKFNLEEIILASNANIGGPTTAAAMAISKGWVKLVGPIMLIGTLGYVIGTYFGTIVGQLLGA